MVLLQNIIRGRAIQNKVVLFLECTYTFDDHFQLRLGIIIMLDKRVRFSILLLILVSQKDSREVLNFFKVA